MNFKTISGGYRVPDNDSHLGKWQVEADRLDHDGQLLPAILPLIKPGMTVLDAGAYNADHAVAYSQAVGATGKVIAIEAGPVFELLKHNCGLFPIQNVAAIHCALWNHDGAKLRFLGHESNFGQSSVSEYETTQSPSISVLTIDTIRELFGVKFDFIKLDIEGAEPFALQGAHETLCEDKPILVIEINDPQLEALGKTRNNIYDILEYYKYTFFPAYEVSEKEKQFDIICHPITK